MARNGGMGWRMLTPKARRFVLRAVRHYIAVLNAALEHCDEDETASLSNDIGYYQAMMRALGGAPQREGEG